MINLILNEKNYAEKLINGEVTDTNPYHALSLLARYYYHISGYRKSKIAILLNEYLYRRFFVEDYEKTRWEDIIERIAQNAKKHPPKEIAGVRITFAEMEIVDALPGVALRKLAFTILCLAKLGNLRNPNNNNWVNYSSKDVFDLANINCRSIDRELKIGTLYQKGLLEFPTRNDNLSYRVTYVNDDSNEAIFVDDFRELGYCYLNYHNGGYIRCRECGILMKDMSLPNTAGRKKAYCKNCAAPLPDVYKEVVCSDCGNVFLTNRKDNRSMRCPYCRREYRREYYKQYKRNERGKMKMSTDQNKK